MRRVFLRTAYNYDVDAASNESGISFEGDPGLTQQSFKDECDINVIMEKFGVSGELPSPARLPTYGDFTGVSDYQTALNAVIAAQDAFMALDPKIRARFANDPAAFVDFCSDPANRDEAIQLGLIAARGSETAQDGVSEVKEESPKAPD